jgi:myo-inositol 2-dehydrogenase / D-chiro-inositol 1-dehydrogenase
VLWLSGKQPSSAFAIGANVYGHKLTTCEEDFDDALLYMWFDDDTVAQVQVSRNHVSGYRVETVLFGEKGQIHVGHFDQRPFDIAVEAYGPRGAAEPLARKTFSMRRYEDALPEFADRFGPAYKTEVATFVDCCLAGSPFPVTHADGLRAQQVIAAAMRAVVSRPQAARV